MTHPAPHPAIAGIRHVIGGNAYGWTADAPTSFAVLDAFVEAGGRMIDTAEGYSVWVPGHVGGESETIIGDWMTARGNREQLRIHTKTGMAGKAGDLAPAKIAVAIDASLKRLKTDYVDLYYAHRDDPETPQEAVAEAFAKLIASGKVRSIGASNFTAPRLASALDAAARIGVPGYSVVQPMYNLVERPQFEGPLQDLCVERGVIALPYYGLAIGFLTGKYRPGMELPKSGRGARAGAYLEGRGAAVLTAMDAIAAETGATLSQIALAWLNTRPAIAAPIAGARTVAQIRELTGAASLTLSDAQLQALEAASG